MQKSAQTGESLDLTINDVPEDKTSNKQEKGATRAASFSSSPGIHPSMSERWLNRPAGDGINRSNDTPHSNTAAGRWLTFKQPTEENSPRLTPEPLLLSRHCTVHNETAFNFKSPRTALMTTHSHRPTDHLAGPAVTEQREPSTCHIRPLRRTGADSAQ